MTGCARCMTPWPLRICTETRMHDALLETRDAVIHPLGPSFLETIRGKGLSSEQGQLPRILVRMLRILSQQPPRKGQKRDGALCGTWTTKQAGQSEHNLEVPLCFPCKCGTVPSSQEEKKTSASVAVFRQETSASGVLIFNPAKP